MNHGLPGLTRGWVITFGQLDMNISYDLNKKIALSLEAINLTNSSLRTYGRSENNVWFAQELQRRFLFGARYRF
ncbi:TonB-dependent receptor [Sphingomonas sp. 10B4]|nr:TonB-dependent receptor [Sphingomonas sp. 10B4]MDY7524408.1 TonB-dependent receptor [Sphingomonas sp. 10B4]